MGQMAEMGFDLTQPVFFDVFQGRDFLEIEAGTKGFACAGDQNGAHIVVTLGPHQGVESFAHPFKIHGVGVLGQIEGNGSDAVCDLVKDMLIVRLVHISLP
jgi:hypothetical protein